MKYIMVSGAAGTLRIKADTPLVFEQPEPSDSARPSPHRQITRGVVSVTTRRSVKSHHRFSSNSILQGPLRKKGEGGRDNIMGPEHPNTASPLPLSLRASAKQFQPRARHPPRAAWPEPPHPPLIFYGPSTTNRASAAAYVEVGHVLRLGRLEQDPPKALAD